MDGQHFLQHRLIPLARQNVGIKYPKTILDKKALNYLTHDVLDTKMFYDFAWLIGAFYNLCISLLSLLVPVQSWMNMKILVWPFVHKTGLNFAPFYSYLLVFFMKTTGKGFLYFLMKENQELGHLSEKQTIETTKTQVIILIMVIQQSIIFITYKISRVQRFALNSKTKLLWPNVMRPRVWVALGERCLHCALVSMENC